MEDQFAPEGLPGLSPTMMGYIALYETFQKALIYLAEMGAAHNRNKEQGG